MKNIFCLIIPLFLWTPVLLAQDNPALEGALESAKEVSVSDLQGPLAGPDYTGNLLETLHYRVPAHHVSGEVRFGTTISDSQNNDWQSPVGNSDITSYATSWTDMYLSASYGITDVWNISLADTGTLETYTTQDLFSGPSNYSNNGWAEPEISSSYRFWGGLKGDRLASISAEFSPATGPALGSVTGLSGNELRGSALAAMSVNGYEVMGASEFSASATMTYNFAGAFQNANGSDGRTWSPYPIYDLGGAYRYHFLSRYFAGISAVLNFPYEISSERTDGSLQWSNSYGVNLQPSLVMGMKVTKTMVAKLEYTYRPLSYTEDYSDGSWQTGAVAEQYVHLYVDSQF